jgi:hypothetical protein
MSREKFPRRLEGAEMFAVRSSPCDVARLWGLSLSRFISSIVTALSVSEARQAAWLKRVNHSSIVRRTEKPSPEINPAKDGPRQTLKLLVVSDVLRRNFLLSSKPAK